MNDAARKALEQNEWVRKLLDQRDELLAALKDLESRRILDCLVQPACGDCSCCRAFAVIAKAKPIPTTCPDCKATNQYDQFCRFCAQHFGPNTNRPTRETL